MREGSLRSEQVAGVTVLVLAGEVDAAVAPAMGAGLPELLQPGRPVVLDLADVVFLDSSGIRFVDAVARGCAARGLPWRAVVPAGSPAGRVLGVVGMLGPEVVQDRASALLQLTSTG